MPDKITQADALKAIADMLSAATSGDNSLQGSANIIYKRWRSSDKAIYDTCNKILGDFEGK